MMIAQAAPVPCRLIVVVYVDGWVVALQDVKEKLFGMTETATAMALIRSRDPRFDMIKLLQGVRCGILLTAIAAGSSATKPCSVVHLPLQPPVHHASSPAVDVVSAQPQQPGAMPHWW